MEEYTVESLLGSKTLPGMRLVAGEDRADNVITGVNTMADPDIFAWVNPGDFLLSTGYVFRNDEKNQTHVLRELARINCAGLGIKVKRYWDRIPAAMKEEADRLGLPLVEIPINYSLAEVSNEIYCNLAKREDTEFKQYMRVQSVLNQFSLRSGTLHEITQIISDLVENPVVLVDSKWRLLAYTENDPWLWNTLSLRIREPVFPTSFLPDKSESDTWAQVVTRLYPDEKGETLCRIKAISSNADNYGFLVVFEVNKKLTHTHIIALESAATTIALERIRAKKVQEVKHQIRQGFFDDLLDGKIESVNAVSSLAEIHNMDAHKPYLCMVFRFCREGNGPETEQEKDRFLRFKLSAVSAMEELSVKAARNVMIIHRGGLIICFLQVDDRELDKKTREILGDYPECLASTIRGLDGQAAFSVGVGNPVRDLIGIRKSFLQAHEAIRLGEPAGPGQVQYYESSMVYHLLDSVSGEMLEEFYNTVLGRLEQYDRANGTNLVETLDRYFESNANISTTAKTMFLHRNTLIYRVEKIKKILSTDLKQPEELLELQLALRIRKLLEKTET